MNPFNICPSCSHSSTCVLTAQKDKVWSCSEYDEAHLFDDASETTKQPKREDKPILELA